MPQPLCVTITILLANANKYRHMRRVNVMMDLVTPSVVTPLELLQGD